MKQFALLLFLATATLIFLLPAKNRVTAEDVCEHTTHDQLCRELVKTYREHPIKATMAVTEHLLSQTKKAKANANGFGKEGDKCRKAYDEAIEELTDSVVYFERQAKDKFKASMNAAIGRYLSCDDSYKERDMVSPLSSSNRVMTSTAQLILELYVLVP